MTDRSPKKQVPDPDSNWVACPTCTGTGKVKGIPPGMIVIRMDCRPRAGAPEWSDSPKEIAHFLGILEKFIRIAIQERYIRPVTIRGKKGYLLKDVRKWYETFRKIPEFIFEWMLEETFPNVPFVYDAKLGGYTVEEDFLRRARRAL